MNNTLKQGLYLHTYISQFSGETIYVVYDRVGAVFTTINESHLSRFYKTRKGF